MKLWFLPIAVVVVKAVLNLANVAYLSARHKLFLDWLSDNTAEQFKRLQESKSRTVSLLKQAGVENAGVPVSLPVGYGYIQPTTARIFDQYPSRLQALAAITSDSFVQGIGTYKGRAIDAVNPLYWLSLIVYLPSRICVSLGAKADSIPVKLLQGLYWLAGIVSAALFAFAKPTVIAWLRTWLDNLAS